MDQAGTLLEGVYQVGMLRSTTAVGDGGGNDHHGGDEHDGGGGPPMHSQIVRSHPRSGAQSMPCTMPLPIAARSRVLKARERKRKRKSTPTAPLTKLALTKMRLMLFVKPSLLHATAML